MSLPEKILLMFILLAGHTAFSQTFSRDAEIGIMGGGMNYIGDLNGERLDGKLNLAGSLLFRYDFHSRWAVQIEALYGTVEGGNPDILPERNLSFSSDIFEASLTVQFNFLPYQTGPFAQRFTPYMFWGLGIFSFNPKTQYTDSRGEAQWYELQPLCTEGQGTEQYPDRQPYDLIQLSMPFGLGIKYRAFKYVTFGLEYGFRKTWTDYLDDVSTTYVDYELLSGNTEEMAGILSDRSGEVRPGYRNPVGAQRGDDSLDDWYTFFGLNITVKLDFFSNLFGRHNKCEAY